ncbi:hypothetical protein PoB_006342200 [Plakobranchus ocellatus]|uniref:Uncharacterized protein n=1 Tax=Plakobranchus ocellatus TaxID=259542 RepID=A0AAV4CYD4_9GAST|nr:hypothetical protein PoB_006342200 [Plakobranchus ocellatus]
MSHYTPENGPADYFPPVAALFQGGLIPNSAALQSLIADIDGQLDNNAKQLDSCLQSILNAANNLPSSRTFSTPKDALGYICSSHTLEKDTCYDPDQEEAVAIIKALCDSLEKNPGSEEALLQEILNLASEEGLILPLRLSQNSGMCHSSGSLNVQLDTMDQVISGKWSKLTESLHKHVVSELLKLPPLGQNQRYPWAVIERRLELVGGLRSLVSDDEAWITYRNIRGQQLEELFNSLLPDNDSENVNYKEFCCNCEAVVDRISQMIEEDFTVLCTGVFKKTGGVYRILHDLYLDKYSDEMSLLVEEIADDIRDFNKKVVKVSKSDHGLTPSDSPNVNKPLMKEGRRGSFANSSETWASKTPSGSQSLETMFLASSYKTDDKKSTPRLQKQSSLAFPKDCITSLCSIALSLMKLEDFLELLTKMTSWDVTGLPNKKTKKKSSLRGVLKPSSSPELKRHSLNLGSSFSSSDTPYEAVKITPPSSASVKQTDGIPAPKVVERSRSEDRVKWDWRLIFKKVAPGLATALEAKLDHSLGASLNQEASMWAKDHSLQVLPVEFVHVNDGLDHPRKVSKDTKQFIQAVDELLPLARAGLDGCLIPVRMAFIDSIGIAFKNFHLHCVSLSKDVPHKANLKELLVIISNAMHIKNYLHHVETVLSAEDNGKKFLSSLQKQYSDLVDGLGKHLLNLHNQLICTAVLTDADSGNWSDLKDFYEDERCSFSVQMWNFHLRGIRNDMWDILSPKLAQSLFSSVLQDSLLMLMQRYSRVKPSYRRSKLLRYDITAVLLCTSEHLLHSCSSVSQYLDPGHNQLPHYSIHNQCSNLLAILAVLTSPIELLYRVFKRGYNRRLESQGSGESSQGGCNSDWLHWIWPSLVHSGTHHYDDMQTASALYLHLRLFLSQPKTDWGMFTQALLMKDHTLSILLFSRACLQEDSICTQLAKTLRFKPSTTLSANSLSPAVETSSPGLSSSSRLLAQHSIHSSTESTTSPSPNSPSSPLEPSLPASSNSMVGSLEPQSDVQQVIEALVHVLARVPYFPDCLAKCIVPAVERCGLWEMFNIKNPLVNPQMQIPEWLKSVFLLLEPFTDRIIEPMLRYLNRVKTADTYIKPVISYVADLPCGCPPKYSLKDHSKPPGLKEVLTQCIQLIILEIEQCVVMLPASLCCLFSALDISCKQQGIKTSHKCVALQIFAWATWLRLSEFSNHLDKLGPIIKADNRANMMTLADNLFHILVYGKGPNTPKFASKFVKSNKEWLQAKFLSISSYISDEGHAMTGTDVTEGATNIFTDHIYCVLASSILDSKKGFEYLQCLNNLVRANGSWLLEQMDVQPPVVISSSEDGAETDRNSRASGSTKLSFKLDISAKDMNYGGSDKFNPMQEMNKIGDSPFSQQAIMEFRYDWVALLTSDLGLSRAAFRHLLMNRYEMQEAAVLEDAEKKPVDVLRAVYEH